MNRYETVIKKQNELIAALQAQVEADQALVAAQERTIHALAGKADILEKQARALGEAGNRMAAENERLEGICLRQQELLEEFSRAFHGAEEKGGTQDEEI